MNMQGFVSVFCISALCVACGASVEEVRTLTPIPTQAVTQRPTIGASEIPPTETPTSTPTLQPTLCLRIESPRRNTYSDLPSPDGHWTASIGRDGEEPFVQFWSPDLDQGLLMPYSVDRFWFPEGDFRLVGWTTDGGSLLFTFDGLMSFDMRVYDSTIGLYRLSIPSCEFEPIADRKWIAYSRDVVSGEMAYVEDDDTLVIIDANGKSVTSTALPAGYSEFGAFAWSEDGLTVAFAMAAAVAGDPPPPDRDFVVCVYFQGKSALICKPPIMQAVSSITWIGPTTVLATTQDGDTLLEMSP